MVKDRMRCITPMSRLEAVMALAHRYRDPARLLEHVLQQESVALFATDRAQADWARHAFITYGKGRHPAQLNLGDCFSYAAARALDAPPL
jgi:ribonuclease VapC